MKYGVIFTVLLFSSFLHAEQNSSKEVLLKSVNNQYQKDLTRQQMLRQARYLTKKHEDITRRLENWEIKKEELKKAFTQKNRLQDKSFGTGNTYGEQRANKRRQDYYKSLQQQEERLVERYLESQTKLSMLKEEFLFKFAVPLTTKEMRSGEAPTVRDKTKKVQMLNEYINENSAWEKCKERVSEFDRVQNVADSIEKLFPETNLTQNFISKKSDKNQQDMQRHIKQYQSIDQEFKIKYGISILNDTRAKAMIENINNN